MFYETITPNIESVMAESDSKSIQNAIDFAHQNGYRTVTVPPLNARTGEHKWVIDKSVFLPSDMTVYLDNCYMVMADDVTESFFRTENVHKPDWLFAEKELHDIHIIGFGNATLDGGNKNHLDELSSMQDGNPDVNCNHPILFLNVRNFSVSGVKILNQRYWGMRFEYCKFGHISNIHISVSGDRRNQDGINLRNGCNNITIENITGQTGDDMIALSAIDYPLGNGKYSLYIEDANQDIHTVIIRNVTGTAICHPLVAMRNHNGAKLYNILIENIMDTYFADPAIGMEEERYATIRIGNNFYWNERPSKMGETYGITIRNVMVHYSMRAVTIDATLKDSVFSNIGCYGNCTTALTFNPRWGGEVGGSLENILLENVTVSCDDKDAKSCLLDFSVMRDEDYIKNLRVRGANLQNGYCAVRIDGKAEIDIRDFVHDPYRYKAVDYISNHPETKITIE